MSLILCKLNKRFYKIQQSFLISANNHCHKSHGSDHHKLSKSNSISTANTNKLSVLHRDLSCPSFGVTTRRVLSTNFDANQSVPYVAKPYSYAFGRSKNELLYQTIGDFLDKRVEQDPNQLLIVSQYEEISRTFAQFNDDVNQIANTMHEDLGLKRGDVAGLWSCNSYNWLAIQYACLRIGVILCTINPVYRSNELDYVLRKGDVKALFMPGMESVQNEVNNFSKILLKMLDKNDKSESEPLSLQSVISIDGQAYDSNSIFEKRNISLHSLEKLRQRFGGLVDSLITRQVSPEDPAIIMFTSGTTGKPKGACLSHFTLLNNAILTSKSLGTAKKCLCVPLPFFHAFAGILGGIGMTASPFKIVIPGFKYDVRQVIESNIANNCTHITATPTIVIDLLNYIKQHKIKLPLLQGVLAGGATMPVEIARQFVKEVPSCTDFRIGYGATESGPVSTACKNEHSFEQRTESIGVPLDFLEIKIVNPATKTIVKLEECGEIYIRGHNTMIGYWKDKAKTNEVIDANGWYNSGDLGTMNEDGFLKIVGRTKDMIIVGGENVYPREIEEILHTHPAIADGYVIGVPDSRKGEEVCAWIKLHDDCASVTEEEIKKFCQDNMSYFKVPKYYFFVKEFPLTPTGKAQKFIMREISCKKLNLTENK